MKKITTEKNYYAMIKKLNKGWGDDYEDNSIDFEMAAYEVAGMYLEGHLGAQENELVRYLKSVGVSDIRGRLADDIYSVM